MTSSPVYWVEGIALVNCGGESCSACEKPAVGRSVSGHLICARHAGMAAVLAEEMAVEVEAAKARRAYEREHRQPFSVATATKVRHKPSESRPDYLCGHPRTPENTYPRRDGRKFCRVCLRKRNARYKAAARRREQARMGFGDDGRRRRAG